MARTVTLTSGGGTLVLGAASGVKLQRALRGTGLPPVQNQWFEGAGNGASLRGARVLARQMSLPFKVEGLTRQAVWDNYSKLALIFAPEAGDVIMTINLDGAVWYNTFVREGGGDFDWDEDTDGTSFIKTVISVKAGDPYFTRVESASLNIVLQGLGRGLLKGATSLNKLQLSTNNAFGSVLFTNPGDVKVYPKWTLNGPFDGFTFTSPLGEVLNWVGAITLGHWIKIDAELGTIVDDTGANKYGGFTGVPRFWAVPAGSSTASIVMLNATAASSAVALWNPKKWMLF